MSEFGCSLEMEELVEIYGKLKGLDAKLRRRLKKEGYHYDRSVKGTAVSFSLDYLLEMDEGFNLFKEFCIYLKGNDFVYRSGSFTCSIDDFLSKVQSEEIYIDDCDDMYFEYKGEREEGSHYTKNHLPYLIEFVCLSGVWYKNCEKPEYITYDTNRIYGEDSGEPDEFRTLMDYYAIEPRKGSEGYTYLSTDRVICYDPEVLGDFISSQNSQSSSGYNEARLSISFNLDYHSKDMNEDVLYSLLDEFCPCIYGGRKWSKPKSISKSALVGILCPKRYNMYIAHLYMEDDTPVLEGIINLERFYPDYIDVFNLTENIITMFGNNIKDVYFVVNDGIEGKVIASKNPDGELTLTIY